MDTNSLMKWLNKELSTLLQCEVGDEYSKNILKIETEPELNEFIGSLLDLDQEPNRIFYNQLKYQLNKPAKLQDVIVYRKPDLEEPSTKLKGRRSKDKEQVQETTKKTEIFEKPIGRVACECQAAKHKLIANCLKCGRIVCEKEGSGPCYFCGSLVCCREELEKIRSGSNKGNHLRDELMKKTWSSHGLNEKGTNSCGDDTNFDMSKLQRAIDHKNKLLDYDRTSAKRTQVIDDESDYFNTNSKWLNSNQRELLEKKQEEIREKRFGSKIGKTFTLDFAGRKVIDEQKTVDLKDYANQIDDILTENTNMPVLQRNTVINQDIKGIIPIFVEDKSSNKVNKKVTNETETFRLQDNDLQEMKDDGMCMSMHQPWASLLVNGIKQHEGRTWYTPFRGRLWIHAASKQPDDVDITEMESFYKLFYSDKDIKCPSSYPTSCLLGYVDLVDCLSSDIYKSKFPNGESESEFVFICKNFKELITKIPMSGQHKLFKLEKNIHSVSKKASIRYHDRE